MKPLIMTITLAFVAAPVFAHGGEHVHIHPHGFEAAILGLAIVAIGALVFAKRR